MSYIMNAAIRRAWGAIWKIGLLLLGILLFSLLRLLLGVSSHEMRLSDIGSPLAMADAPVDGSDDGRNSGDDRDPPEPYDRPGDSSSGDSGAGAGDGAGDGAGAGTS